MPWKTALHSVSYAGLWGQARLSLESFLERAHSLGFEAIMLMAKKPHLSVLDGDAVRQRLRAQLEKLGLNVACLSGYNDFGMSGERPASPPTGMQIPFIPKLSRTAP